MIAPFWEPYMTEYRNIKYQKDFPDGRYIPKRSMVIKNKQRNTNKKNKRRIKK